MSTWEGGPHGRDEYIGVRSTWEEAHERSTWVEEHVRGNTDEKNTWKGHMGRDILEIH